jgi:8-oxo-dGTP pyrophosphatase MutT (NUDIX family)
MPDHLLQAAALPIRDGRVCMVTSRRRTRWVVPKGRIDRGHTPPQAAITEAWEEAGVVGDLRPTSVGTYHYEKDGRSHLVTVFVLDVTLDHPTWPECRERTREWVTVEEAIRRVNEPGLKAILRAVTAVGGVLGPPLLVPNFAATAG